MTRASQYLRIGGLYRYSVSGSDADESLDGLPNFFNRTRLQGFPRVQLDRGIAPIGRVKKSPGVDERTPAILISSTIHNKGSALNPWQDLIESDLGFARYFGDQKKAGNPALSPGNKLLIAELERHLSSDPSIRATATPILIFSGVKHDGRIKGNKRFEGLAVIEKAELITQYNPKIGYFTNYVFQFAILSLTDEFEELNWQWINDRRSPDLALNSTLEFAPKAWKYWVRHGVTSIDKVRRKVSTLDALNAIEQRPAPGSAEEKVLQQIYNFYTHQSSKHSFEHLASLVVMDFINSHGGSYEYGWITRGSGDGGVDFVGKIRLGQGFPAVQVLVLGQAKCEKLTKGTSAKDLARTVARLKRGWIGAYVTTSYFSKSAQAEMVEDGYPLIKINGLELAKHAIRLRDSSGYKDIIDYLKSIDTEYPQKIELRRPEEIITGQLGQDLNLRA